MQNTGPENAQNVRRIPGDRHCARFASPNPRHYFNG